MRVWIKPVSPRNAAHMSGVLPPPMMTPSPFMFGRALGSAPRSRSRRTDSASSAATAAISAVAPNRFCTFTSAPCSRRKATVRWLPGRRAARISALLPSADRARTSAPCATSIRTFSGNTAARIRAVALAGFVALTFAPAFRSISNRVASPESAATINGVSPIASRSSSPAPCPIAACTARRSPARNASNNEAGAAVVGPRNKRSGSRTVSKVRLVCIHAVCWLGDTWTGHKTVPGLPSQR